MQSANRAGVVCQQPLAGRRARQIVIAARRPRAHVRGAGRRALDDRLVECGVERRAGVGVEGVDAGIGGVGRRAAEIEAARLQLRQSPARFVLECRRRSLVAAGLGIRGVETRDRLDPGLRRPVVGERAKRDQPLLHRRCDLTSHAPAHRSVIAKRRRQISEHRIGVARDRHQIRGRRTFGDARGQRLNAAGAMPM